MKCESAADLINVKLTLTVEMSTNYCLLLSSVTHLQVLNISCKKLNPITKKTKTLCGLILDSSEIFSFCIYLAICYCV